MEHQNRTTPQRFILLGFSDVPHIQVIIFITFLMMYLLTISGNLLLIIIVRINPRLHSPMYFFLTSLSLTDIFFSSSTVPFLLMNIFPKDRSISSTGCATQMYFSLAMGVTECTLLAIMAFDRYVAICRPLHYNTIMSKRLCLYIVVGSWSVGFINSCVQVFLAFQLPFCQVPNINHYFCEVPAFIRTACGDTFVLELSIYITGTIFAVSSFYLILISYIHIISKILKIISSEGRQKSFSTCASHLTAVILFYGTVMFMYMRPQSKKYSHHTSKSDNIVPIFYATVTPMLNPFIYSVRNQDVKNTLINHWKRKTFRTEGHGR